MILQKSCKMFGILNSGLDHIKGIIMNNHLKYHLQDIQQDLASVTHVTNGTITLVLIFPSYAIIEMQKVHRQL